MPMDTKRRINNTEIRLLKLREVTDIENDRRRTANQAPLLIACSVDVFKLSATPQYQALSYTWGKAYDEYKQKDNGHIEFLPYDPAEISGEDDNIILVNGKETKIGKNLFDALRQLLLISVEEWLWVDAICINQADHVEKAAQIPIMGRIFAGACQVTIWLGMETNEAKSTFFMVNEVSHIARAYLQRQGLDPGSQIDIRNGLLPLGAELPERLGIPDFGDHVLTFALFCRKCRWFSRLWCTQEVFVARKASLMCGEHVSDLEGWVDAFGFIHAIEWFEIIRFAFKSKFNLQFDLFLVAYKVLAWLGSNIHARELRWSRLMPPDQHRQPSWERCLCQLYTTTLDYAVTSECSDPHDKIYALLGTVDSQYQQHVEQNFIVDYSQTVEEHYINFTRTILEGTNCLDILSIASPHEVSPTMPTWVVDLRRRCPYDARCLVLSRLLPEEQPFNAAQGLTPPSSLRCTLRSLSCSAVCFDEIQNIVSPAQDFYWIAVLKACQQLDPIINGKRRLEVLWRTLITDKSWSSYSVPVPDEFERSFLMSAASNHAITVAGNTSLEHDSRDQMEEAFVLLQELSGNSSIDPSASSSNDGHLIVRLINNLLEVMSDEAKAIEQASSSQELNTIVTPYALALMNSKFQMIFTTKSGGLGHGTYKIRKGDKLFLLAGASTPYVLRPTTTAGEYKLAGDCFILDCMHGEILARNPSLAEQLEDILIV